MQLFGNSQAFAEFEQIQQQLMVESTSGKPSNGEVVKNLERAIRPKIYADIEKYVHTITFLIGSLDIHFYPQLIQNLIQELERIRNYTANMIASIRTLRTIVKQSTTLLHFMTNLSKLDSLIDPLYTQLTIKLTNYRDQQKIHLQTFRSAAGMRADLEKLLQRPRIWLNLMQAQEATFIFQFECVGALKIFEEFELIEQESRKLQKSSKAGFTINDLLLKIQQSSISAFQTAQLCEEILFLSYNLGILERTQEEEDRSKEKTQILVQNTERVLNEVFLATLQINFSSWALPIILPNLEFPLVELTYLIQNALEDFEQELIAKYQGDLSAVNRELQEYGTKIFSVLQEMEQWLQTIHPFFGGSEKILQRYSRALNQIRGDLGNKLEDFESYAQSIHQNRYKLELEKTVHEKLAELEKSLIEYHEITYPFIIRNMPNLDQLLLVIDKYMEKFQRQKREMLQIFEDYSQKAIDITPSFDLWEEKYEEVIQRTQFTIKNTITSIFNQFNEALEREHTLMTSLLGLSVQQGEPATAALDFVKVEAFSEKVLRERIEKLSQKIEEINNLQRSYEIEKERLRKLLEDLLKKTGVESKKCIICHKPVNVTEDHYVRCEFCGSISHYTCSVFWIQRFNACPLCSNQYTIPHNEIYDPSQMEEDENSLKKED